MDKSDLIHQHLVGKSYKVSKFPVVANQFDQLNGDFIDRVQDFIDRVQDSILTDDLDVFLGFFSG